MRPNNAAANGLRFAPPVRLVRGNGNGQNPSIFNSAKLAWVQVREMN